MLCCLIQQEKQCQEKIGLHRARCFQQTLKSLKDFKERKGLRTLADAAKVCVEYCDAHGVFK